MSTNYKAHHYAVFSGLLLLPSSQMQISFSVQFSKTLATYILNVRDQVSHPYKTPGKGIVFYILTSVILETKQEDK
jgi:hypothetical protein